MIEAALDKGADIDVAAVARVAVTSEHHFRRMFSTLAGMSLSEYVRRRRLTLAASDVLSGDRTLLDVAVRHGYSSTEAFNRAFRAVHGVTAGEARRRGATFVSQPRISFHLVVEGSSSMRFRIVEKDAFRIVGRKARVPLIHLVPNQAVIDFVRGLDAETRERIAALSDQEPTGSPWPGPPVRRCALRSRPWGEEELLPPAPEVPHRGQQAGLGVAEPVGRLHCGQPLVQVGAERLVPAVGGLGRGGEELTTGPGWGRFRCLRHGNSRGNLSTSIKEPHRGTGH